MGAALSRPHRVGGLLGWRQRRRRGPGRHGGAATDFDVFRADVANIIPPQRSARLVDTAGLAAGGDWCPVDQRTFESAVVPRIHLLGDAVLAGAMPKSGFSANNQAKVLRPGRRRGPPGGRAAGARLHQHLLQPARGGLRDLGGGGVPARRRRRDRPGAGLGGREPVRRAARLSPGRGRLRARVVCQHYRRHVRIGRTGWCGGSAAGRLCARSPGARARSWRSASLPCRRAAALPEIPHWMLALVRERLGRTDPREGRVELALPSRADTGFSFPWKCRFRARR